MIEELVLVGEKNLFKNVLILLLLLAFLTILDFNLNIKRFSLENIIN